MDTVFEDEDGFYAQLQSLVEHSRVPIVITCRGIYFSNNYVSFLERPNDLLSSWQFKFEEIDVVTDKKRAAAILQVIKNLFIIICNISKCYYLQLTSLAFGRILFTLNSIDQLLTSVQWDMRMALMYLQYICTTANVIPYHLGDAKMERIVCFNCLFILMFLCLLV